MAFEHVRRMRELDLPPLLENRIVSLDTEASGLFVDDGARCSVVSLAWRDDDGFIQERVYPFDQGLDTPLGTKTDLPKRYPGPALFDVEAPNLSADHWCDLAKWLRRQRLVYHNSKYDQHIMRTGLRGIEAETRAALGRAYAWDTMVVAPLLWPNESNALKAIAEKLWGEGERQAERDVKSWLDFICGKKGNRRYDIIPWQLMEPYARGDASMTLRLYEYQMECLEAGELDRIQADLQVDFAQVLYRMEARGVGYDYEAASRAEVELAGRILAARQNLTQATQGRVTTYTEARMRVYWFGELKLKPKALTSEGKPSITDDVVRGMEKRGVPAAAEYRILNKLETANSMWYGTWHHKLGMDGRLRTSYWQTKTMDDAANKWRGTVSGRLAVERIQLQAIPQDYQIPDGLPTVRSFFKPKPGHILVEMDMNQAEMRLAAGITNCKGLLEGFARGDDAHAITTRLVFDMDEDHPDWKQYRNIAKRLNFGMIYGAGTPTIRRQILIYTGLEPDLDEVGGWVLDFRDAMPELSRGARNAEYQVDKLGYVDIPGGGRRYFRFGEEHRKAFNARIQGGVAACMTRAQIEIEVQHEGIQLLQIHDSVIAEVTDDDEGRAQIKDCKRIMADAFTRTIGTPFMVDAKKFK